MASIEVEEQASALYAKLEACVEDVCYDMPDVSGDDVFFELAHAWCEFGDGETEMTPELRKEFRRITGLGDFEW